MSNTKMLADMLDRAIAAAYRDGKHVEMSDEIARAVVERLHRFEQNIEATRRLRVAYDRAIAALAVWKSLDNAPVQIDAKTQGITRLHGRCRACDALDAKLKEPS